jgi:hydroxymethylbilane synthase
MASPVVRIGTRASKLALAQSGMMQRRIAAALGAADRPDEVAPLVHITTTGDRIQDRRLLEIGGKALFTKEIEEALLDGRIDAAGSARVIQTVRGFRAMGPNWAVRRVRSIV